MIFKARVLAGEFDVINKHLITILKERGIWCKEMREKILTNRGSVQNIDGFPEDLKPIFKTVWEIKMKTIIDMAADRGAFIDQSQSMNLWLPKADVSVIASMILYAWEKGLKTLCYYLHIRSASDALPYSVSPEILFQRMKKSEDDRYIVTTTLDEESLLNVNIDPIHPLNEDEFTPKNTKRKNEELSDDDDIIYCPYNPTKKSCKSCSS